MSTVADLTAYHKEVPPAHVSCALMAQAWGAEFGKSDSGRDDVLENPTIEDMMGIGMAAEE